MADARALGMDPVVDFDAVPTSLKGQFDIVFDTVGTLSPATARLLRRSGGHIIDIVPTPMKFIKSLIPGSSYTVQITKPSPEDLEELANAFAQRKLQLAIAETVPLADAIPALTELERHNTPKGGKLIITVNGH